ncbi:hypothetical protein [Actinoallomurus rhizosphaericola]|uniref:hypothetical protein n=1 Tax=Actinoallomurus rhizosphaericola TaxID=2952536 RepID=UPI002091FA89|nr:hypothetical protein [Actinoallomurus rhizosphaericola]MCO5997473.1 hypothetical protein [Actinoallomurus rhizosphaericola]
MGGMPSRNRRLRRGQSWPVTLTELAETLGDAHASVKPPSFDSGATGSDVVLAVRWVPARSFNHGGEGYHPSAVGIHVSVYPVRSVDRAAVRSLLRSQSLPELREWVIRAQLAPESWRSDVHFGCWRYAEDDLRFEGDRPV